MAQIEHLRPIERRILAMSDAGLSHDDIAGRIRRSPEHVGRIIGWTEIPRANSEARSVLAREARVLKLRRNGETHEEIGRRFRRSAGHIRRIEGLAHLRRAHALLSRAG